MTSVRANSSIGVLTPITVSTKDLKSFWEIIINNPTVNSRCAYSDLLSMIRSIVINMVNCKKQWFCFSTTRTYRTIMRINQLFISSSIFSRLFSCFRSVFNSRSPLRLFPLFWIIFSPPDGFIVTRLTPFSACSKRISTNTQSLFKIFCSFISIVFSNSILTDRTGKNRGSVSVPSTSYAEARIKPTLNSWVFIFSHLYLLVIDIISQNLRRKVVMPNDCV